MKFNINSDNIKKLLERGCDQWVDDASETLTEKIKQNTVADSGKTREGWNRILISDKQLAIIGNPFENAIWEEFGTGEYAVSGDGRKGGWTYCDSNGDFHFTYGKQPRRPVQKSYTESRGELVLMAEQILKEVLK